MKNLTKSLAILLLSSMCTLAQAHIELSSSQPKDQELLASSPEEFVLLFTSNAQLLELELFDENANPVEFGFTRSIRERVNFKIPVTDALSSGVYVLKWTVLAGDGHRETGTILFGIDDPQ